MAKDFKKLREILKVLKDVKRFLEILRDSNIF